MPGDDPNTSPEADVELGLIIRGQVQPAGMEAGRVDLRHLC